MSDKSEVEKKRRKAVAFAQQISKLTKPENFERAMKAVEQNNFNEFKKICKELKINNKLADQMWTDFSIWKCCNITDGWTNGWTSGLG